MVTLDRVVYLDSGVQLGHLVLLVSLVSRVRSVNRASVDLKDQLDRSVTQEKQVPLEV